MVAAIPQRLVEQYGHWADKIPAEVLADLTEDQVHGRLKRAQSRWDAALGPSGDGDLPGAMAEAGEILAAPVSGAAQKTPSALKAAGVTAGDMDLYGRWISQIPDEALSKMDRPSVVKRAQVAAAEFTRTGSTEAADRILTAPAYVAASEPMTKAAHEAYRRGVREDIARQHGRWVARVPDEVLGKLDAVELLDRCEHAAGLERRGTASPHPGMIHGYLDNAAAVLRALPAAEVEAEVARLEKAARLTDYPQLAQGYREQARQVRATNPQAPVRPRPGVLGKALRPTAVAAPRVLNKAVAPAPAKPVRRRRGTIGKADSRRLGMGLDALEAALLLLRDGGLNKADGPSADAVIELLDASDDLLSGRVQP